MKTKYVLIAVLAVLAAGAGISAAHAGGEEAAGTGETMMDAPYKTMSGMMQMMGMHNGLVHDSDEIEWMREEMKEHGFTEEEFNDMAEHCPMMGRG